jgi:hypothetical protein
VVVEEPLHGGTASEVVRVGDTVRRRTSAANDCVRDLLGHLDRVGFDGSPRFLGIDEFGREILSFVEGDVTAAGSVPGVFSDAALAAAARLLRRMHDATRGHPITARTGWTFQIGAPTSGSVVCHNDLGPYNSIFVNGLPIAFIDWDLAAPAPPEWDVAYALWRFVPLYDNEQCAELDAPTEPRHRRMRVFLDAYGLDDRRHLLATIRQRQQVTRNSLRSWADEGDPVYQRLVAEGRLEEITRNIEYAKSCAPDWSAALGAAQP